MLGNWYTTGDSSAACHISIDDLWQVQRPISSLLPFWQQRTISQSNALKLVLLSDKRSEIMHAIACVYINTLTPIFVAKVHGQFRSIRFSYHDDLSHMCSSLPSVPRRLWNLLSRAHAGTTQLSRTIRRHLRQWREFKLTRVSRLLFGTSIVIWLTYLCARIEFLWV